MISSKHVHEEVQAVEKAITDKKYSPDTTVLAKLLSILIKLTLGMRQNQVKIAKGQGITLENEDGYRTQTVQK